MNNANNTTWNAIDEQMWEKRQEIARWVSLNRDNISFWLPTQFQEQGDNCDVASFLVERWEMFRNKGWAVTPKSEVEKLAEHHYLLKREDQSIRKASSVVA